MFGRFMPKEAKFFDLFTAHVSEAVKGAEALETLMDALKRRSPEEARKMVDVIDDIESRADVITRDTISLLHATFITPLDRNEIHQLISRLDDVLDNIQDAAQAVTMYDIQYATPEMLHFADLITQCVKKMHQASSQLSSMDNSATILATCKEIYSLEAEADVLLLEAMSKLFREEQDVRELIRLKAVYEKLEEITDRADGVANIIEAIVLENS
jgi:predicted phosphate transport protein (TIGR00153 family)